MSVTSPDVLSSKRDSRGRLTFPSQYFLINTGSEKTLATPSPVKNGLYVVSKSLGRQPRLHVSSVTTSTLYPAFFALLSKLSVSSSSCGQYSWNQASGPSSSPLTNPPSSKTFSIGRLVADESVNGISRSAAALAVAQSASSLCS